MKARIYVRVVPWHKSLANKYLLRKSPRYQRNLPKALKASPRSGIGRFIARLKVRMLRKRRRRESCLWIPRRWCKCRLVSLGWISLIRSTTFIPRSQTYLWSTTTLRWQITISGVRNSFWPTLKERTKMALPSSTSMRDPLGSVRRSTSSKCATQPINASYIRRA